MGRREPFNTHWDHLYQLYLHRYNLYTTLKKNKSLLGLLDGNSSV
jgi:hypothetical protein